LLIAVVSAYQPHLDLKVTNFTSTPTPQKLNRKDCHKFRNKDKSFQVVSAKNTRHNPPPENKSKKERENHLALTNKTNQKKKKNTEITNPHNIKPAEKKRKQKSNLCCKCNASNEKKRKR